MTINLNKQRISWLICSALLACTAQDPVHQPAPNVPSATAVPTVQAANTVFSLEPTSPCLGKPVSLTLISSGFERSQLPIALFPVPQSQPIDFETPGGNKYPPPQDSSTVLLGELSVSPLGTGELQFTLQANYVTRGGQHVEIRAGQSYLLYWQERPGAFTYITDIVPQNCPTDRPQAK